MLFIGRLASFENITGAPRSAVSGSNLASETPAFKVFRGISDACKYFRVLAQHCFNAYICTCLPEVGQFGAADTTDWATSEINRHLNQRESPDLPSCEGTVQCSCIQPTTFRGKIRANQAVVCTSVRSALIPILRSPQVLARSASLSAPVPRDRTQLGRIC